MAVLAGKCEVDVTRVPWEAVKASEAGADQGAGPYHDAMRSRPQSRLSYVPKEAGPLRTAREVATQRKSQDSWIDRGAALTADVPQAGTAAIHRLSNQDGVAK